jgi:AraC family transcriptional regulator
MTTALRSEGWGTTAVPMATAIANLIELAEAAIESDRDLARDCITRALALLRTPRPPEKWETSVPSTKPQRGGLAPWQARRVAAHIDTHLASRIRTQDLTALTKLSVSHFSRAFKASFGVPPLEYVAARRIKLACELMLTTDESICQIALACGLCDQSHFCRVFRRVIGASPNVWRRAHSVDPSDLAGCDETEWAGRQCHSYGRANVTARGDARLPEIPREPHREESRVTPRRNELLVVGP